MIIGTGGIARSHIAALGEEKGRVRVVAVADTDPSRARAFCDAYNIPEWYASAEEMLEATRPALVHICTPPSTHLELIVLSLKTGAWVFCEKPLCASLAQMDEIEAAERQSGAYCSSVLQWRFGSGARHLKGLIQSGELGRPLVGLCQTTWYRDQAYYEVPWRGKWATELGGASMGQGIHAMDLLLWLLGDWREVRAMMGTLDREMEVEDVSAATVRFENGAIASIINSVLSPRQETRLRLDFQEATVELESLYGYTNQDWRYSIPETSPHQNLLDRWRDIPKEVPASHASQLAVLLDCMEQNKRPPTSGREARRAIEFLSSLYKSAITAQPVRRGSIGKDDPFYHRMSGLSTVEERPA